MENNMEELEKLMRETLKDAEQKAPEGVWSDIESRLAASRAAKMRRRWISATVVAAVVVATAFAMSRGGKIEDNSAAVAKNTIEYENMVVEELANDEKVPTVVASKNETKAVKVKNETAPEVVKTDNVIEAKEAEPQVVAQSNVASVADKPQVTASKPREVDEQKVLVDTKVEKRVKTPEVALESEKTVKENGAPEPKVTPKEKVINIPNVITPNGDGFNDCWRIPDLEQYSHVAVQIFTAKSQRIYSSNDYHGEFCGADLPEGNYFYVIRISDINYSRRGVLVIKR